MKKIIAAGLLLCSMSRVQARMYLTRNGNISFPSHTPLEEIKAQINEAVSVLNSATCDIVLKNAVKGFHFSKRLQRNRRIICSKKIADNIRIDVNCAYDKK